MFNIILSQISIYNFKKNNFPPNILHPLKEDIILPKVEKSNEVPKKIYRCGKDLNSKEKYQKVFDKTSKLMADYEQIFYTDEMIEKFIKNNFEERIYNAYKKINPIYGPARADFFRYLIIYLYGGIYMDIKSGPIDKKINNIIEENKGKLLTSVGSNFPIGLLPIFHLYSKNYDDWSAYTGTWFNEYAQWYIISSPGNEVMSYIIKQMISNIENGKNYNSGCFSVVAMTGPIMYTRMIKKYGNDKNCKVFYNSLNSTLTHHLIDYKKIEGKNHYRNLEDKKILVN
jgi:inositol phosphorylceramide mannosyltransferase catalytic subunit